MNRDADDATSRLDALESKIAYQDDAIETLNATITAQWKEIDALKRQVAALGDRVQEAEAAVPPPSNEPPPHY